MNIHPKKLSGKWKAGFALDVHTLKSTFLGHDEFGHEQYDTERSEVGELLYRLKYRNDKSVVKILAETAAHFVKEKKWPVELIVAVPPSKTGRKSLEMLAKATSRYLEIPVCLDCIVKKRDTPELKEVYDVKERRRLLSDVHAVHVPDVRGRTILLLDDLYRSGATLAAVADTLLNEGHAKQIYVLTFTKTRSNR